MREGRDELDEFPVYAESALPADRISKDEREEEDDCARSTPLFLGQLLQRAVRRHQHLASAHPRVITG